MSACRILKSALSTRQDGREGEGLDGRLGQGMRVAMIWVSGVENLRALGASKTKVAEGSSGGQRICGGRREMYDVDKRRKVCEASVLPSVGHLARWIRKHIVGVPVWQSGIYNSKPLYTFHCLVALNLEPSKRSVRGPCARGGARGAGSRSRERVTSVFTRDCQRTRVAKQVAVD